MSDPDSTFSASGHSTRAWPRAESGGRQRPIPQRLGLFGGTFNPIHNGHLGIARQTLDVLQLDRVLFIPTGDPPHKEEQSLASARHRYQMVQLAIAGIPSFGVSDIEVARPGKSYSIDTIRALQRQYGRRTQMFFLIGLDAFLDLPNWKEPQALLETCRFVVISRPGTSFRALSTLAVLPNLATSDLDFLDSSRSGRLDISLPVGPGIICLSLPPSSISASDIRERIKRGAALANLLPPPVESFIIQHRLYQEDPDRTNI